MLLLPSFLSFLFFFFFEASMAKKNKRYCYITARLEGTSRNKSKSLLLLSLYSTSRSNFKQDFRKVEEMFPHVSGQTGLQNTSSTSKRRSHFSVVSNSNAH